MDKQNLNLRNIDLVTMVNALKDEQLAKRDLIVPSTKIEMCNDIFIVEDGIGGDNESLFKGMGIDVAGSDYFEIEPTELFHRQMAEKMGIPIRYYWDMLHGEHYKLLNDNVNYWLNDRTRNMLLRTFIQDDNKTGIGRAFLSDKYRRIDNLDLLVATLDTMTGIPGLECTHCDITETNIYAIFENPNVKIDVPELIENYRNPSDPDNREAGFTSGFTLKNSEVGRGGFSITPRGAFVICGNGMTSKEDAYRQIHIGSKTNDGFLAWNEAVENKNLELVRAQMKQYMEYFISTEYLQKAVKPLYKAKGIEFKKPVDVVKNVTKNHFNYSDEALDKILGYFHKANDESGLGVVQALTYFAHETEDANQQHEIEANVYDLVPVLKEYDHKYVAKKENKKAANNPFSNN